jgi:hypothetical protein
VSEPAGNIVGQALIMNAIAHAWGLSDAELLPLLAYEAKRDASRWRRLYAIHVILADLFVDPADEERWLREPLPLLDGASPLGEMQGGWSGISRVEAIVRSMANHG